MCLILKLEVENVKVMLIYEKINFFNLIILIWIILGK